ncbi:basic proline-rich protein-like [Melospiza georgiana]|uniref:basic proline-rich protein-like n=1 Tax=Melospiza georgiana TaxID=44398 RepID=UPI0025ACBF10|nr:basic proline-rich protein-like [Melospiza georgiana]
MGRWGAEGPGQMWGTGNAAGAPPACPGFGWPELAPAAGSDTAGDTAAATGPSCPTGRAGARACRDPAGPPGTDPCKVPGRDPNTPPALPRATLCCPARARGTRLSLRIPVSTAPHTLHPTETPPHGLVCPQPPLSTDTPPPEPGAARDGAEPRRPLSALRTSPGKDWSPRAGQDPGPWGRRTPPHRGGRDPKLLEGTPNPWMGPSPPGEGRDPHAWSGTGPPVHPPDAPLPPPAAPRVTSVPRGGRSRCPAGPVAAGDTVRPHVSGADSRAGLMQRQGRDPTCATPLGTAAAAPGIG